MRLLIVLLLILTCISCKKEEKKPPIPETTPTTQKVSTQKKRRVTHPDTTRYDSIKNNFSLTSRNFNENRIDFTLPKHLEDFQIEFSNIPNDRLKLGYNKKENAFFIGGNKVPFKKGNTFQQTNLSILLDSLSVAFSVNGNASYLTENISISKPYTVMTFSSKKHTMTNVVVSKHK